MKDISNVVFIRRGGGDYECAPIHRRFRHAHHETTDQLPV